MKVSFESTVGALHTNAKLQANSVTISAQHVFIQPEAIYFCSKIRVSFDKIHISAFKSREKLTTIGQQ